MSKNNKVEPSLDPSDWDDFREKGHRIFDDMVDGLAGPRAGKAWGPMDEAAIKPFRSPVPKEGLGLKGAYRDYVGHVRPHPMGLNHPRFWGWAGGAGTPDGMIAEVFKHL